MDEQTHTRARRSKQRFVIGFLTMLLLLATVACGFLFMKYKAAQANTSEQQRKDLVGAINKTVLLPTGEEPGLSTVVNKSKLTNATLRERAQNGDKLLIYAKAGRLIIFRPSVGKVVDILTIQSQEPANSEATSPSSD